MIRLFSDGEKRAILFADDGEGLNLLTLKTIGARKGLFSSKNPGDLDIAWVIFATGLSTREDSADEISGRGIGMDAVADIIREIGGEIRIIQCDPFGRAPAEGRLFFGLEISLPE